MKLLNSPPSVLAKRVGTMVVEARVRIRHRGCITERLVGDMHGAQISADRQSDVLVMHAPTSEQVDGFVELCRGFHPDPIEILSRTPTSVIMKTRHPRSGVVASVLATGCSILWPAIYSNGEEHYTIMAPTRERLENLVAQLQEIGEVALDRLSEVEPEALEISVPLSDLTAGLTERQLAVLLRAIRDGYYDSPRRTTAEALAAAFGVTRSTFEEHLRKAERRVLERFADVMAAQPALARAATRRPGRPARAASVAALLGKRADSAPAWR